MILFFSSLFYVHISNNILHEYFTKYNHLKLKNSEWTKNFFPSDPFFNYIVVRVYKRFIQYHNTLFIQKSVSIYYTCAKDSF